MEASGTYTQNLLKVGISLYSYLWLVCNKKDPVCKLCYKIITKPRVLYLAASIFFSDTEIMI